MKKLITPIIVVFPQLVGAAELVTCKNILEQDTFFADEIFVWSDNDQLTKIVWSWIGSTKEIDCLISEVIHENYCYEENYGHSYPNKIDLNNVSIQFKRDGTFDFEYNSVELSFDPTTKMPIKSRISSHYLGRFDCNYPRNLKFLDYEA